MSRHTGNAAVEARVFLGLGTNLGDRPGQLRAAVDFLEQDPAFRLTRTSSIYETAPVGPIAQPAFLNAVVEVHTRLSPRELLERLKAYERAAGRVTGERWGPRAIDLDILTFDRLELDEQGLHIPHRELIRRAFVLVPFAELEPALEIGGVGEGRTVAEWLGRQRDLADVVKVGEPLR